MAFQSVVNSQMAFGVAGEPFDNGPRRSAPWALLSASADYNVVGATAYTVTSGPATPATPAIAAAGGSGVFAGILVGPKEYATSGTVAGGALAPTMVLPNYTNAELLTQGAIFATLSGAANIGDQVIYDLTTGALSSMVPVSKFTASIAAGGASTADVLTVTAVSAGVLAVGQIISGVGIAPGTYIVSLGTGKGYTGTYNLSSINTQTVASEAMTAPNALPGAVAITTGSIATSGGVDTLTVTTLASGQLRIGMVLNGAGIAAGTTITAFSTGVGGTGTYTLSSSGQTVTAEAMTADAYAVVWRYAPTGYGTAVIKLV